MLGFFQKFFKVRCKFATTELKKSASAIAGIKPRARFDDVLSPYLRDDYVGENYALLFDLYRKVYSEGYEASDHDAMLRHLQDFRSTFQEVLIKESSEFYRYLQQNCKDETSSLDVIKDFRTNMNGIAAVVIPFCQKYRESTLMTSHDHQFESDYREVGRALANDFILSPL